MMEIRTSIMVDVEKEVEEEIEREFESTRFATPVIMSKNRPPFSPDIGRDAPS